MSHPAEAFRALHVKGDPFILANVWDKGSALMLQNLGAKALATSSAAYAFTQGRPDGGTLTRDESLAHAADILSVTTLPVQGDFENGFGDDPDTCAETVRLAAEIGLAGICIEDIAFPSDIPYDHALAVERIRAASAAARALPHDFVLTARADGVMTGHYDTSEALRRLLAFEAAGADCLYAPFLPDMAAITKVCATLKAPVNVLIAGDMVNQTLTDFAAANAARLSLGSSLARITHAAIHSAATTMLDSGSFAPLAQGISGDVIDRLLTQTPK